MKKIVIISIAFFCCLHIAAQNTDQSEIKQKISKTASTIRTMQCDFVQTKQLKMLNDKMVSHGKMYYKQGSKLRWEYTSPYTYIFLLNGTTVVISNNKRNDVIDVNQSNIFKEIVRIMMNCMIGKSLTDERDFSVTISTTSTEWVAKMIPQRKEMKKLFKQIILHFNKQKMMVSSVELIENNGDTTLIELKNIKTNATIDDKLFIKN